MIPKVVIVQRPPTADKILKNVLFGTARGMTKTAQEGQQAVLGALKGTFTIRGRWSEPGNRFGIKIKAATPRDPSAEVRTRADWLQLHETGGTKTPRQGSNLAIPTDNVRRTKRMIIQKGQRPRNLKNAFKIKTRRGEVLAVRQGRGKNKQIKFLYNLRGRAQIKKESTFFEPIQKVVARRLQSNVRSSIKQALRSMK